MQKRVAPCAFAARAAASTVSKARASVSSSTPRVIALRLRAIAAILGAAARLDRQQRRELHRVRRMVVAVDLLRAKDELGERQRIQCLDASTLHAAVACRRPRGGTIMLSADGIARAPRLAFGVRRDRKRLVPFSRARRVSGGDLPLSNSWTETFDCLAYSLCAPRSACCVRRAAPACALRRPRRRAPVRAARRAASPHHRLPGLRAPRIPWLSAAPALRVRRPGRARRRRSSTRFPSTGYCSELKYGGRLALADWAGAALAAPRRGIVGTGTTRAAAGLRQRVAPDAVAAARARFNQAREIARARRALLAAAWAPLARVAGATPQAALRGGSVRATSAAPLSFARRSRRADRLGRRRDDDRRHARGGDARPVRAGAAESNAGSLRGRCRPGLTALPRAMRESDARLEPKRCSPSSSSIPRSRRTPAT